MCQHPGLFLNYLWTEFLITALGPLPASQIIHIYLDNHLAILANHLVILRIC